MFYVPLCYPHVPHGFSVFYLRSWEGPTETHTQQQLRVVGPEKTDDDFRGRENHGENPGF